MSLYLNHVSENPGSSLKWRERFEMMIEKLEETDLHNAVLPNMREIDEQTFSQSRYFTYLPMVVGTATISNENLDKAGIRRNAGDETRKNWTVNAALTIYHDYSGYAMIADRKAGKIRYFEFTFCLHQFHEVTEDDIKKGAPRPNPRHTFHTYICSKCSYVTTQDSSD